MSPRSSSDGGGPGRKRRRARRVGDRGRGVDEIEQPAGRGLARAEQLQRQRQRLDGLERGDRGERQEGEEDGVDAAADDERDRQREHDHGTQARHDDRERGAETTDGGKPLGEPVEPGTFGEQLRPMGVGLVERCQVAPVPRPVDRERGDDAPPGHELGATPRSTGVVSAAAGPPRPARGTPAARRRATDRTRPAGGRRTRPRAPPTIGGHHDPDAKSSSVSTSAEIRASRSPLRCVDSRAGASGSIAAKNHTRRSARMRRSRDGSRSAPGTGMPPARSPAPGRP